MESLYQQLCDAVMPADNDAATAVIIADAVRVAVDVTHECGTPEATYRAALETYRDAICAAYQRLIEMPSGEP